MRQSQRRARLNPDAHALQLWGGVECTINRVGDQWYDQLEGTGHPHRLDDFDQFAAIGIRRLRQPVLWERHVGIDAEWEMTDAALARIRNLGVIPIVGLLHHGSGPAGTSLVDDHFASGLSEHAGRVATRYPWVEWYTPVNEPLTTARFSGLYGLWYPHARDAFTFARAIINQCRATVLAMRAIRLVNPAAKLVQTEDLGRTYSTASLVYQADLENERRWLTWDLLCGRVDRASPIIDLLRRAGISRREIAWFADNPCPPDIIGINHYVTSDRYLDHRLDRYRGIAAGGNGRHRYVDVEAVRARVESNDGWSRCLDEAWRRYGLPLAITEAHLGCTRDEQMRWIKAAWTAAKAGRAHGIDIRAVTAWALLGSRDWDSLLTRHGAHFESGVFDIRADRIRATGVARMLRQLVSGCGRDLHPASVGPGWWSRPDRLLHPRDLRRTGASPMHPPRRPLLITGAAGNLGRAFAQICQRRGLEYRLCTHADLDICSEEAIDSILTAVRPWALINAAGYVRVDDAEWEGDLCYRQNFDGPTRLAAACARQKIQLVTFSSDLVFDGRSRQPYVESSPVAPINTYGESKARAEQAVLSHNPCALVIRTSGFFGPWHPHDFLPAALRALSHRKRFAAMDDVVVSHTYVPDLANACIDLLIDAETGIWHLANAGAVSWCELARRGAHLAGIDARLLEGRACSEFKLPARRPPFSALATERGLALPPLDDALARYVRDASAHWATAA